MAKKDKEKKNDDELNEESQGEINESDDTFGLPDIDYKPLEEEESEPEDEPEVEVSADDSEESDELEGASEGEASEETDQTATTTAERRFTYEEDSSSAAGKIILGIIAIVVIIGAIWFFGFYRPKVAEEKARQEQAERDRIAQEEAQRAERARQQALAEQQAAEEQAAAEEEQQTDAGNIGTISETTNRYYVIVGSFIDEDLAMDYAKALAEKGVSSNILAPRGSVKFHRLAIGVYDSWQEAQAQADQVKGEYGDETWVVKY